MSVYTKTFAWVAGPAAANTDEVVYTVPTGYVAVLKTVTAINRSGAAASAYVRRGTGGVYCVYWNGAGDLVARETRVLATRVVFTAGQDIAINSTATTTTFVLSGYLFAA